MGYNQSSFRLFGVLLDSMVQTSAAKKESELVTPVDAERLAHAIPGTAIQSQQDVHLQPHLKELLSSWRLMMC